MKSIRAALLSAVLGVAWIPLQARAQLGSLVVTMTSPASGSTVSGTTTVSASVTIIGLLTVQSVQFQLDGNNLGAADASSPYSISWNTTGASNGSHTLSAVATATLGLQFSSNPITVTVNNGPPPDTTPPSVSITSPANGASVSGTTSVTASASDNVGVASVQFTLDGANLGAADTAAPYSVSWNTTGVPNGSHTLSAVARDAAGNTNSASVTVTVANAPPPDTTPPSVSFTAPANGATVKGTVSVSASASDNVGVVGVQFLLDNGANGSADDTSAPYSISWNTTTAADGSHTITAVARDAAGNTTSASITVTVSNALPPDTTPPSVSITAPANGATVKGTVSMSASASDNVGVAGVQFKLDGTNLGAEDTSAPYSISWNTTSVPDGPHTITAVARDAAGNQTPATITVTVSNAPPRDTTPPTVSITAPANGATAKGTVSVSANASDNVGVVAVQFLLDDGANGSAEATTAPYSISWNTATASDGSHKITAVARDAAGNSTPSAPVTVTVANNVAPPPPAARRFEDTDPSVTYTAGWRSDAYAALSAGGATASDAAGAQATFTFTGTSVSWIGGRWTEEGIARVFLDGTFVAEVDTYSKTKEVQVPLFTALDLANTSHTLMIEATGQRNVASNFSFVLVDAFDVPAVTISRLQDSDPAVVFSGSGWLQGVTGPEYSGGTVAGSLTAGDRATFTFTGTGIRWLGELGPDNGGIARVFLDGALVKEVNTYAPSPDPNHHSIFQAEHFKATGLADASHTLAIEVTGQQDPAALRATVIVDAFDVITSGTRHEETDPAISYTAGWLQGNRDQPYSQGTAALSTVPGDRATFTFTGTSVSVIGFRGPQTGIARVILDGNVISDAFDTYSPTAAPQKTLFTLPVAAGTHTLAIEVTGSKNPASTGTFVVVDAFDVTP